MSKSILIFSDEFPPDVGGAGFVAMQYAESLSSVGYKVTVSTRFKGKNKQNSARYFIKYSLDIGLSIFSHWLVRWDLQKYDVILLNDPAAMYIAGIFFGKKNLSKCICFFHGSEVEYIFKKPKLVLKFFNYKFFVTRALRHSANMIVVSSFLKKKVVNYFNQNGVSINKTPVVIRNGVDKLLFSPVANSSQKRGKYFLVSCSRVVKTKGYVEMLNIFFRLNKKFPNTFHWNIVGDGVFMHDLKLMISNLNLSKCVTFFGVMDKEGVASVYNKSDIFWLLSQHEEGFGLSWLEAQICGLPAISLNNGAVKEVLLSRHSLIAENTMEVYDYLARIVDNGFIVPRAEVRSSVLELSSEVMVQNLIKIINEIK